VSRVEAHRPGPETIEAADPLASFIDEALAGDRAQLARVLRAVTPAVLAVVRAVLGAEHADVADVAQDSLIAFEAALPAFRRESTVAHYARRIALRIALSAQRRSLRRRSLDLAHPPSDMDTDPTRSWALAEDPALRARRLAAFRELLQELPAVQAESLALRAILEYSLPQIAAQTGAPVNTVRSRVRLAIEALRRRVRRDPALREILEGTP
jgi:RNA polymerase sigma factor (sigma-70 family)